MTWSGFPASVPVHLCVSVSVRLPLPNRLCAFRCRNKSQKSKFDEELHNEMTTTIDELSSKYVYFYSMTNHTLCMWCIFYVVRHTSHIEILWVTLFTVMQCWFVGCFEGCSRLFCADNHESFRFWLSPFSFGAAMRITFLVLREDYCVNDLVIPWLFIRLNYKNFQYFGLWGNTCRANHIPISLSCTVAVLKLKLPLQPKKHFPIDDHYKRDICKQNDGTRDYYQVLILAGFIFVKLYLKKKKWHLHNVASMGWTWTLLHIFIRLQN